MIKTIVAVCVVLFVVGLCIPGVSAASDKEILDYANMLLKYEKPNFAAVEYMRLINTYPKSPRVPEAWFNLFITFEQEGKYWLAIKEYENFIKKYPSSKLVPEAKKNMGRLKVFVQKRDEYYYDTETKIANLYIEFGNNALSQSYRWWLYGYHLNDAEFESALNWYDRVIKEFPDNLRAPHALWAKAAAYDSLYARGGEEGTCLFSEERRENTRKGIEVYKKIVEKYSESELAVRAQMKIAEWYYDKLGNREKTIEAYNKVIEIDKNGEDSYYVITSRNMLDKISKSSYTAYGYSKIRFQDTEWGGHSMESEAAERLIWQADTFVNRACMNTSYGIVFEASEIQKAFDFYDQVIREYPNSRKAPKAYYQKAQAYTRRDMRGDYKKSIKIFEELIEKYPDTYWVDRALLRIAQLYQEKLGSGKKAIETYKRLIERHQDEPYSHFIALAETQIKIIK